MARATIPTKKQWEPRDQRIQRFSGSCEREIVNRFFGHGVAVRAARTARLGAGAKRFVDDGLDGTCATAAFGTAAEASIDLLGTACDARSCTDGIADIMVAEDVAGTD